MKKIYGVDVPDAYANRIAEIKPSKISGRGVYEVTLKPKYVLKNKQGEYYFVGECDKKHLVKMLSEAFEISDSEYSFVRLTHGYGMGF